METQAVRYILRSLDFQVLNLGVKYLSVIVFGTPGGFVRCEIGTEILTQAAAGGMGELCNNKIGVGL
jgi:hypothetical protein